MATVDSLNAMYRFQGEPIPITTDAGSSNDGLGKKSEAAKKTVKKKPSKQQTAKRQPACVKQVRCHAMAIVDSLNKIYCDN